MATDAEEVAAVFFRVNGSRSLFDDVARLGYTSDACPARPWLGYKLLLPFGLDGIDLSGVICSVVGEDSLL